MRTFLLLSLCVSITRDLPAQGIYFPLQPGNVWHYAGYGPWSQLTVSKDTILPNRKQYAVTIDGPFQFLRQEGNQVYQYNFQSDELLFDFSMVPRDTVNSIPGGSDTTDIILSTRDSVNLFGKYRLHWVFDMIPRHIVDGDRGIGIVDSIGIVELFSSNSTEILQSALIDGRLYQSTGVAYREAESAIRFSLAQNFPNPFNPRTRISYSIPTSGVPLFRVFNSLGQTVLILNLGFQASGPHVVDLDGKQLSSGVYFYRLDFGSSTKTMKCILMK